MRRQGNSSVLVKFPSSPTDRTIGAVPIACQRHFNDLFPEAGMRIRVRATGPMGSAETASYTVLHRCCE
jgi:hypothetical protein